jgi:predicted glutamine amidotransferase
MCRFVLYLGEPLTLDLLTTRPAHSLIQQSAHARERPEPLNGDGFGIAWYANRYGPEPALFRSTTPAWNNSNLRELARVTESGCILAHVRAATPPLPVTELNCHPFKSGPVTLMHNGFLPGFSRLRRDLLADLSDEAFLSVKGSTDSEHILGLFADRHRRSSKMGVERLVEALTHTIHYVEQLCLDAGEAQAPRLNLAVSDGHCAVVSRCCRVPEQAESLHLHYGKTYTCIDGVCQMVAPEGGTGAVIVASEPLSNDPGWEAVPPNHLVIIAANRSVRVEPLARP